jgi:hypothetical protein
MRGVEVVMAYFKVISQHLFGGIDGNCEEFARTASYKQRTES